MCSNVLETVSLLNVRYINSNRSVSAPGSLHKESSPDSDAVDGEREDHRLKQSCKVVNPSIKSCFKCKTHPSSISLALGWEVTVTMLPKDSQSQEILLSYSII